MPEKRLSVRAASATAPAQKMRAVTPDDAADLPQGPTRGLHVGAAGAVKVLDQDGVEVTLTSGAGQYHPVAVSRVLATGTTASGIVALY